MSSLLPRSLSICTSCYLFFFFNDPATTEIYTLSLHDALPICSRCREWCIGAIPAPGASQFNPLPPPAKSAQSDRKSTRLNSSHQIISYAVFCLKKKKKHNDSRMKQQE